MMRIQCIGAVKNRIHCAVPIGRITRSESTLPMSAGSGYDYNPVTYSNEGRMFQVEYAGKAVENGGTAIGVKCADGVVLGVEKLLLSPMLVKTSNRRIFTVDSHVGVVRCGVDVVNERVS